MSGDFSIEQRNVIKYAKEVSGVLMVGLAISLATVAARLFGEGKIEAAGISVPLQAAWGAIVVATAVHLFLAFFFLSAIHELWLTQHRTPEGGGAAEGKRVFDEIKIESNPFLRSMIPRSKPIRSGGRVYRMSWSDPSTWVAHFAVFAMVLAVLPWHVEKGSVMFQQTSSIVLFSLLASLLAVANWTVGARWSVSLSQLTVPRDEAYFHYGLYDGWRGMSSAGGPVGPFDY